MGMHQYPDPVQLSLGLKADDSSVVHRSGNETISGTKTFNTAPVVPNASIAASKITSVLGGTDLGADVIAVDDSHKYYANYLPGDGTTAWSITLPGNWYTAILTAQNGAAAILYVRAGTIEALVNVAGTTYVTSTPTTGQIKVETSVQGCTLTSNIGWTHGMTLALLGTANT